MPIVLINIFKNLYLQSSCFVKTDSGHTDFFEIVTGVRQGCILSPLLFLVSLDYIMRQTGGCIGVGIHSFGDLDFVNGINLLEEDEVKLQNAKGIATGTQLLEEVDKFNYLGSVIAQNGDAEMDVKCSIGKRQPSSMG